MQEGRERRFRFKGENESERALEWLEGIDVSLEN